jgi:uncharacterized protein YkwD
MRPDLRRLSLRAAIASLAAGFALMLAVSASPAAAANCPFAGDQPESLSGAQIRYSVLCLLNHERRMHGLAALHQNGRLRKAATAHARDMVARRYFAHETPGGGTFVQRIVAAGYLQNAISWVVGENLAWGTGDRATPAAIVDAWMHSPPHRENILKARYREIGIGHVLGNPRSGAGGITFGTEFGTKRS